ncbi:hypothetical protein Ocin01_16757 [Orchesella cincta]|uniref:Uncharacterized protein n=1 Tax=Orchesella cincta TaxID=48709 RepID=A0A1D2MAB4_ORCCI|nr:hypothetical protein Ocin01_16757 [Orchesella cincta]
MIIYSVYLQLFGILLTYASPPSPPIYGQSAVEIEPSNMQNEFARLISKNLAPEQCRQLYQYVISHDTSVVGRLNEFEPPSRNIIPSGRRQLLPNGKECIMKLENLIQNSPDVKELIYDGLAQMHRTDLTEQLKSWMNYQKHLAIMKAMKEIKSHTNTAPIQDKVDHWSKGIMDLMNVDLDIDEFKYTILIIVLIGSTCVTLIIAKCIMSAKSRLSKISKARKSKIDHELKMLPKDQLV